MARSVASERAAMTSAARIRPRPDNASSAIARPYARARSTEPKHDPRRVGYDATHHGEPAPSSPAQISHIDLPQEQLTDGERPTNPMGRRTEGRGAGTRRPEHCLA